jgi:trans-aconitate methyltransferase
MISGTYCYLLSGTLVIVSWRTGMVDWTAWQRSWDRQQEWYMPDREDRFKAMLDAVEAVTGTEPRVLDLACGTGSITARVRDRFPKAVTTGVDLDPALLTIARGSRPADDRTSWVTADLRDPDWLAALPHQSYDAVLTATALHWLRAGPLRELYRQLASVVRPGGVFANADHMPDPATPRINAALAGFDRARRDREQAAGVQDWAAWWQQVAAAPELAEQATARFALLGDPVAGDHSDGEPQSPAWHTAELHAAGFTEARPIWAGTSSDAMILAVR